ncbi:MAG: sigma-70 family RNA polymerase sigma factor [Kiritimatiellae bacterium]|nr:sigma-70 family RNA polymerase sigma factor [Kiritimatiellia bacterium]
MTRAPTTSVTLLKALSGESDSARWTEFFRKYEGPMRAFLAVRYPSVEADDVIQETLKALARCLPNYRYVPDERGHFHNYLMGIVRHKADDACRAQAREAAKRERFRAERPSGGPGRSRQEDDAWRMAALQAALDQLMADQTLVPRTREIFRHVALMHEPPESVAAQFGTTRNNVDQIKKRLVDRLAKCVAAMTDGA